MKLLLLLAPFFAAPQDPAGDALAELVAARQAAFALALEAEPVEAARIGAEGIRQAAERLSALPAGPEAQRLADEIELFVLTLNSTTSLAENSWLLSNLLEDVHIPERYGAAHAMVSRLGPDPVGDLALLVDWEFVGPFDNERGRGVKRSIDAESRPGGDEVYEGKQGEISWRRLPQLPAPRGRILFRHLLDPASQICVLARSWVQAPRATRALLMLGAAEEARVWVNGAPVFEALGEHDFSLESFAIPVELREGWNELAIKVGSRDGQPAFTARLADFESGAPLRFEQRAERPEGLEPQKLSRSSAPLSSEDPLSRPGAWRRWSADSSAEGHYNMALLQAGLRTGPRREHPGREDAARAVELAPDVLRHRLLRAITLLDHDASRAERDVNPWLHAVTEVLELDPDQPLALSWMAWHASDNQPTYQRALGYIDRARQRNPASIALRLQRADLLAALDQDTLAELTRLELADDPEIASFGGVGAVLSSLPLGDPRRDALELAACELQPLSFVPQRAARRRIAEGRRGVQDALEELAEYLAYDAWNVGRRLGTAGLLMAQDEIEAALGVLDEALVLAPERAAIHRLRARAFLQLNDTERASSALEALLECDFGAERERRLLEYLRAEGRAPFHEAFQEDLALVLERDAALEPMAGAEQASREVLLKRVVIEVNPDGTARRYTRLVQRVLNETGARDLDRMAFSGGRGLSEVRVLAAQVAHPDGTLDSARTGRARPGGRVVVDLPPLEVGDVVDVEWRADQLSTTFFGHYFGMNERLSPDPSLSVRASEIVVLVPDELPLHFYERNWEHAPEIQPYGQGMTLYRWTARDIAPRRGEQLAPPIEEYAAAVQGSSYASWDEFGQWWWDLIEHEITVSPEMRAKVAELVAGCITPSEKLRAIYDFVVTDIRYNAWEFGVHGYQPYSAPVIFSRGFGDCKDKAILLRALLSEVDIEAFPVIIRAEGRRPDEDLSLAMVEHFNHCIAWLPEQEGLEEMFLDGTARHHPLEVLPEMDNGARVVVVRPDGIELKQVPIASYEANTRRQDIEIDLTDAEGPRVVWRRELAGRFDPRERQRFDGSQEERQENAERLMTAVFGPLTAPVEAAFSALDDLGEPTWVQLDGRPERVTRPTDRGYDLPAAIEKLDLLSGVARESEREADLLLDVPWRVETVTRWKLGEGPRLQPLPPPIEVRAPDASYSWSAVPIEGGLEVREVFALETQRIPPERYPAFRELCRQVDAAQNAYLEVEVTP